MRKKVNDVVVFVDVKYYKFLRFIEWKIYFEVVVYI